jgi:hypothetical protein
MSMVSGMVASSWMGNGRSFVKSLGDFGDLVTTNPRHVRQLATSALPAPHHNSTAPGLMDRISHGPGDIMFVRSRVFGRAMVCGGVLGRCSELR